MYKQTDSSFHFIWIQKIFSLYLDSKEETMLLEFVYLSGIKNSFMISIDVAKSTYYFNTHK